MTTDTDAVMVEVADVCAAVALDAFRGTYDGTNEAAAWAAVGEAIADRFEVIGWRCGGADAYDAPAHMLEAEPCPLHTGCDDRPVFASKSPL